MLVAKTGLVNFATFNETPLDNKLLLGQVKPASREIPVTEWLTSLSQNVFDS